GRGFRVVVQFAVAAMSPSPLCLGNKVGGEDTAATKRPNCTTIGFRSSSRHFNVKCSYARDRTGNGARAGGFIGASYRAAEGCGGPVPVGESSACRAPLRDGSPPVRD